MLLSSWPWVDDDYLLPSAGFTSEVDPGLLAEVTEVSASLR